MGPGTQHDPETAYKILDKGFLILDDQAGTDLGVVHAAQVSVHKHSPKMEEKEVGILRFLMNNKHGTPFEHNYFRFRVKAPLVVFREWHRHRIGHSYNEWSARYSELEPVFYIPDYVRTQVGKPGAYRYEAVEEPYATHFRRRLEFSSQTAFDNYKLALESGIAKEQARLFLPVNIYSEMYWTCNARSLMAFLELRNAETAMWEIKQFAQAAESIFMTKMPLTCEAFIANGRIAP